MDRALPRAPDRTPSLSVAKGQDGRILLTCFAGCTNESIVGALNLKPADLFPDRKYGASTNRSVIEATYGYTDEGGKLLFECVRYTPKDFRQRRPDPDKHGKWIWDLKGVRRVLYRLPELMRDIAAGETIYVCAGEKDADAMRDQGFAATTMPLGEKRNGSSWLSEFTETLQGAAVVLMADRDETGRSHADAVANKLRRAVRSLRLIELSDRNGKPVKDPADWLAAGGTAGELRDLVESAPEWAPSTTISSGARARRSEYFPTESYANGEPDPAGDPPRVYVPPPLDLLPSDMREWIHATAEALSVDISMIFLAVLSALAAAIGN